MKNQIERLEYLVKRFPKNSLKLNIYQRVIIKKLEILKKNPEYMDKLIHFEEKDLFMTSSHDIIICVKLDTIKQY